MTTIQILIVAVVSALATPPAVVLIPRARQSPAFDRILWGATWVLAFIGAWIAPSYLGGNSSVIDSLVIAQVSVIPTLIGAAAGALFINSLLWLIDRFATPVTEEGLAEENSNSSEEENVGERSTSPPNQQ